MILEITGKPKHVSLPIVRKAAKFYGEYLLGKLHKNIYLSINFEQFERGNNDYAYCDWVDNNIHAREFEITIHNKLSKKETLLALAHEMVHLKQYARGELKDIFRPVRMVRWMGENIDPEATDYWELPFEIEAFGRERGLYIKFMNILRIEEDGLR